LPFLFIYNPTLILYGVDLGTWGGLVQAAFVFVTATFAMLLFAAATQGYFLARSRIHESVALLLVAFTLFVPNVWLDMVQPRFDRIPPAALEEAVAAADPGDRLRLVVSGPDLATGVETRTTVVLDIAEGEAADRIGATGLMLFPDGEAVTLEEPMFGSPMADTLSGFDFYGADPVQLVAVEAPADRLPAQLFYIPALLLLGLVIAMQRRRQTQPAF
jgi:hypothetical protein